MEVFKPGIHFENKKPQRAYVTVINSVFKSAVFHTAFILDSRVEVLRGEENHINEVIPSLV